MESVKANALESLGLSRNEVKVLLSLTRLGSSSAGQVTKDTGLHRRNVYDSLQKLSERGLVGHVTRGRVRHYQASDPRRLLGMLREKRQALQESERLMGSLLDGLLRERESRQSQDVSILFGREGRRAVFEDILETARDNLVLGGYPPTKSSQHYMAQYNRRRARKGIMNRMIYNRDHPYLRFLKSLDHTEVRMMPRELDSRVSFNIYGSKVALLFHIDGKPVTILIENPKVANDFREYFSFLWDISNPA